MPLSTQQISEAIRFRRETRILLKEGRINKEEASHRIANAKQVIVLARAAIELKKNGQVRSQRTSQREL